MPTSSTAGDATERLMIINVLVVCFVLLSLCACMCVCVRVCVYVFGLAAGFFLSKSGPSLFFFFWFMQIFSTYFTDAESSIACYTCAFEKDTTLRSFRSHWVGAET